MNQKISIISALLTSSFLCAQSIKGTVTNKENKPEAETEIIITRNKLTFSSITDEKGEYAITLKENGDYIIEILKDGIKMISQTIAINGTTSKDFQIEEPQKKEEKIEEVSLTVKKKLFERKVDRLVFNVENSVASQGIDVLEALAKTPMVKTTDNAISIAGKSNVAIMVNDRLLNLSGQELVNYLKTLRSDDVSKIEVITTPPARYDAEGKSGLINIVLKKIHLWDGTVRYKLQELITEIGQRFLPKAEYPLIIKVINSHYPPIYLQVIITGKLLLIIIYAEQLTITTGIPIPKAATIINIKEET